MFSPCSELGIFMYGTCNSMSNLLSYCGLIDAKIRASDKDLPVYPNTFRKIQDQSRSLNLRKNSDISIYSLTSVCNCVYCLHYCCHKGCVNKSENVEELPNFLNREFKKGPSINAAKYSRMIHI